MLQKLRFQWRDDYQYHYATLEAAHMLVAWLDGRSGPHLIAAEHFAVDGWDDVVVDRGGRRIHYQVKDQNTPFDASHPSNRPAGSSAGQLTPLDKAFKALAQISQDSKWAGELDGHRRRFILALPTDLPQVKSDLTLKQVTEFVERCNKKGQNAEWMADERAQDGTIQATLSWLETWCDFRDVQHMLRALKHAEIQFIGMATNLIADAESALQSVSSSPKEMRKGIFHFLKDNSDVSQATTARLLFEEVGQYVDSVHKNWILYHSDPPGSCWIQTGPMEVTANTSYPDPGLVSTLWTAQPPSHLRIQAACDPDQQCTLRRALLRLALHAQHVSTNVSLEAPEGWRSQANQLLSRTLGLGINDGIGNTWGKERGCFTPTGEETMKGSEVEEVAERLERNMDRHTFEKIIVAVNVAIPSGFPNMKDDLMRVWNRWRAGFENDHGMPGQFLRDVLSVKAEQCADNAIRLTQQVDIGLRVGPATVDLVVRAILLQLLVAASLDPEHRSWEKIQGHNAHLIALEACAKLAGNRVGQRGLIEDQAELVLLEETSDLVILAGVSESPASLLPSSLMDDHRPMLISDASLPKQIVTRKIKRDAAHGLNRVREVLDEQLTRYQETVQRLVTQGANDAENAG